ncbi:nitrate- and nitrite sensing domain-containing protein [Planomonospora sp. ID82291]|uniref:nitrate- and nitrite sensing domain-containing protein n=1 Tax=Planomonospora sp. ID82291 TaxID=2738136 RepID=UPI0018C358B5|nr:nitrate- and nitrite sensing domain-containing protein [Planomonospora sp. ID82291]MBG0812904.1 nitrate- and nitrite sensing domain-containing protein [Planomonospora sp. ID82291]
MKTQDRRSHRAVGVFGSLLPANWRVRPRLVALILLPTVAAVLLTGLQLTTALSTATEYRRTAEVASLIERLGVLSHEMAAERDLTAWYIADQRRPARLVKVREQREAVDRSATETLKAVAAIGGEHAARVRAEASQIRRWLHGLPGLRRLITEGSVLPRAALGMYSRMIADFVTLHDDLGRSGGDERLTGDALTLGALSRAKEQVARQRGILLVARLEGGFDFDDPADFLGAYRSQVSEVAAFQATASAAQNRRFRELVSGPEVDRADATRALVMSRMRENRTLGTVGIRSWFDSSSAVVDGMRTLEREMAAAAVQRSQDLEAAERRSAMISGGAILVLLVLILLITAWVAASLVSPLRKLRSEALEVAGTKLPETVRVLRESADLAPNIEVPSIGVLTRDEIGEVARAFDEVHREAIRLAGDEARLRANVNAMFVNLSRRTQSLVERQIDLIDDLEQGEQDDDRLASLFKLDHLATRMRRNSENLLVLAGQEQSRRWSEPVPLGDVVRASLSEVENYERVTLRVESGTLIIGQAVNDIVHLIAELVENAIFFSPQDTKITVTSNGNEMGSVVLAVTDSGIGMSDEELAEANRRLAEPPAVDLSVSRRMGLFVVGRLALRHGIRVQLRRPEAGGLSAVVLLPPQVVAQSMRPDPAALAASAATGRGAAPEADPFAAGLRHDPFGSAPAGVGAGAGAGAFGPGHPSFEMSSFGAFQSAEAPLAAPGPVEAPPAVPPSPPVRRPGERPPFGMPPMDDTPFGTPPGARSAGAGPAPEAPAGPSPSVADLWSKPVVSASDVESLWSSPLTPTPPPPSGRPAQPPAPPQPSWQERSSWQEASAAPEAPEAPVAPPSWQDRSAQPPAPPQPSWQEQSSWQEASAADPWSPHRLDPGENTQMLPAVGVSATEPEPEEFLPIFAAVGSDWFRSSVPVDKPADRAAERADEPERSAGSGPAGSPGSSGDSAAEHRPAAAERQPWSSTPADQGWAAAEAVRKPAEGGLTGAGLPKRVPKANLVPGSAPSAPAAPVSPMPPISAERVRSRLSSFQQGVRQGRAEMNQRPNAAEGEMQ